MSKPDAARVEQQKKRGCATRDTGHSIGPPQNRSSARQGSASPQLPAAWLHLPLATAGVCLWKFSESCLEAARGGGRVSVPPAQILGLPDPGCAVVRFLVLPCEEQPPSPLPAGWQDFQRLSLWYHLCRDSLETNCPTWLTRASWSRCALPGRRVLGLSLRLPALGWDRLFLLGAGFLCLGRGVQVPVHVLTASGTWQLPGRSSQGCVCAHVSDLCSVPAWAPPCGPGF